MKLLVPVDGSKASVNAAKCAVEFAKKDDYVIKLISIVKHDDSIAYRRNEKLWRQVDGSIITGRVLNMSNEEVLVKIKQGALEILETVMEKVDFTGITIETEILLGEPYEKILEVSKKDNVDMIIMGNRGFSRIKRFFVGSVTQRVIAEALCPVLVVHAEATEE